MTQHKRKTPIAQPSRRAAKPAERIDLGKRQQTAKALQKQLLGLKILAMTPSLIYIFDRATQQDVFANRTLASVLDYPPDQTAQVGSVFLPAQVHPDDAAMLQEKLAWATTAPDGEITSREYRVCHANGTWHWIGTREMVFSRADDGTPKEIMGMAQDITERKQVEAALRESEARLRTVMDNAPDTILQVDQQGTIWFVNHSIPGLTQEQIFGTSVYAWVPKEQAPVLDSTLKVVFAGGERQEYETLGPGPYGQARTYRVRVMPVIAGGQVTSAVYIATDISERKRAEQALKDSELKYRSLIEVSGASVFAVDRNGAFKFVSQVFAANFHQSPDYFLGKTFWDIYPQDQADYRQEINRQVFETGASQSTEGIVLLPDKNRYFLVKANPMKDETGQVVLCLVYALDITELKQTEAALRENKEALSLFMKHSPIFAYLKEVTPTTSRVLQASDNFQEMIGIPGSQMTGKTMAELFPAEFAAKLTADDWAVVSGNQVLELDEDLNDRHYTSIKFPINLGDKTLLAGYTIDITERKQLEEHLRAANVQLADQLAELHILHAQVREQAIRDPLTQLYNRRYLNETLPREIAFALRQNYAIGILMLDIDHFKNVNDTYGHLAGDETLQAVAYTLTTHLRASDMICRYGGEEFLCLLLNTTQENTLLRAEELRAAIADLTIISAQPAARVTISTGVALLPSHGSDMIAILKSADAALYQAKADGRNCVRLARADQSA